MWISDASWVVKGASQIVSPGLLDSNTTDSSSSVSSSGGGSKTQPVS